MCTGVEIAQIAAAVAVTNSAMDSSEQTKKAANRQEQIAANATNERKAAETQATQDAYTKNIFARKALRDNSLFTGGGQQTLGV